MQGQLFLLKELIRRDFHGRYAGSALGLLWPFLQPLWQLFLFTFVFATVMKIPVVGERTESFAVFLFCGLLPWMAIHEGIQRSATAITDNANLVKNVNFQSEILILAVVCGGVLHQAIATGVFLIVLAAKGELAWSGLPLLVVALPLQVLLTLGLGFLVCAIHTIFRDTVQVVSMVMTGWFYLTPIVYPLGLVPEQFRPWLEWNPLTTLVALYRLALLGGEWVGGAAFWKLLVATILLLFLGLGLFRRLSRSFVDEI